LEKKMSPELSRCVSGVKVDWTLSLNEQELHSHQGEMFRWLLLPTDEAKQVVKGMRGQCESKEKGKKFDLGTVDCERSLDFRGVTGRTWWPVSQYRTLVDLLSRHQGDNPELGVVGVDIVRFLEDFKGPGNDSPETESMSSVIVTTAVEELCRRPSLGQAHSVFASLFDKTMGWKAQRVITGEPYHCVIRGELGEIKTPIAPGWGLEKMTVNGSCETWVADQGGDPVAWLRGIKNKTGGGASQVELSGRRVIILNAYGEVEELTNFVGRSIADEHYTMEAEMSPMEIEHLMKVIRDEQDKAMKHRKVSGQGREYSIELATRNDVTTLQQILQGCVHGWTGRRKKSSSCTHIVELSTVGAVVPCGARCIRVTEAPPDCAEYDRFDDFAAEVAKKSGLAKLPAQAVLFVDERRLKRTPKNENQLDLHLMMLARVNGFKLGMSDIQQAWRVIAGYSSESRPLALTQLALGQQWPLHLQCDCGLTGGDKNMTYAKGISAGRARKSACAHCRQPIDLLAGSYACGACNLELCETCANGVHLLRDKLRYLRDVVQASSGAQTAGSLDTNVTGDVEAAFEESALYEVKEDIPTEVMKRLCELVGGSGSAKFEDELARCMPVRGKSSMCCQKRVSQRRLRMPSMKAPKCSQCLVLVRVLDKHFTCQECANTFCYKCGSSGKEFCRSEQEQPLLRDGTGALAAAARG